MEVQATMAYLQEQIILELLAQYLLFGQRRML